MKKEKLKMIKKYLLIVLACVPMVGNSATFDCLVGKGGACIQCVKGKVKMREIVLKQNENVLFQTEDSNGVTLKPSFCTKYTSDQNCPAEHPDKKSCATFKSSNDNKTSVIISFSVPNDDCKTTNIMLKKEAPVTYLNTSQESMDIKINELKWKC